MEMHRVHFRKEDVTIHVPDGRNLRQACLDSGIDPYPALGGLLSCRGKGFCGTCAVEVDSPEALTPATKREARYLRKLHGRNPNIRLSCQAEVKGAVTVTTGPDRKPGWQRHPFYSGRPATPPAADAQGPSDGSASSVGAASSAGAASSVGAGSSAAVLLAGLLAAALGGCATRAVQADLALPGERHLARVRQLTFGGQNAEAYWSFDDRELIFQSTRDDGAGNAPQCDQIFIMDVESGEVSQVTTQGRTTCAYFLPRSDRILFASTHAADPACPPEPDRSQGYVWPLYDGYEIYTAERDGTGLVNITNSPGYDAEATVRRQDGRIVFTSVRSGDLELWTMDADGGDPRQLTDAPGYDGGAFFSPDGTRICWRASRFDDAGEQAAYFDLLGRGLVRPSKLDIYVMDADGGDARRLTDNGKANFAPYFTPDGRAVLFASNMADPAGRAFDIWRIGLDDRALERVTWNGESFDGFPMFSWSGKRLAFSSNRFNARPHETNVFVADWID